MSEVTRFRARLRNIKDDKMIVSLSVAEVRAFIQEYDELEKKYTMLNALPVQIIEKVEEVTTIHVTGGTFG